MFALIQYFNMDLDPLFLKFISTLQISFKFPSIFDYFVDNSDRITIPTKYQNIGFDTNLIMINSGANLTIFVVILTVLLILFTSKWIMWILFKKDLKKINKLLMSRLFTWFWIQTIFDLTINSIIGIYLGRFENKAQIINFIICSFLMVISKQLIQVLFSVILMALIAKRVKITEKEEENFLSNYGALFEEFKYNGLSSCYFYLIFIIRRYAIIAAILFFTTPLFKLLVSFVFSIIVKFIQTSLYLIFVSLCKDKINQIYLILNEALTAIFYGYVGLQFLNVVDYDQSTQGYNCIKMIEVSLGLNCVFGLISGFYNAYRYFVIVGKVKLFRNLMIFLAKIIWIQKCRRILRIILKTVVKKTSFKVNFLKITIHSKINLWFDVI